MEDIKKIDSKCCKELYVILDKLKLFYKLPDELQKYIIENQDISYEYDFNIDFPLMYQIENPQTKEYISYLYLKYINDKPEEKDILLAKYVKNEEKYQTELRKKYNPDDIFKSSIQMQNSETISISDETNMTKYKDSILRRIFHKIKSILHKK